MNKILGIFIFLCICFGTSISAAAVTIPASDSRIQYFGRWDKSGLDYSSGQGATYIKMNFYGTDISINSYGDHSWWRYSIDKKPFVKFKIENGKTVLAENISCGKHSILLVRSTEGEAGISYIKSFELNDGGYLLPPSPLKKRRLEFVGDSISAGACNDGEAELDWYDKENGDMAYGPQLARMLNADYSVVARSGEGVIRNYGEAEPYEQVHSTDRYSWMNCSRNFKESKEWNFTDFPVDGVLVALGTNDFSIDSTTAIDEDEFVNGYMELITKIREYNPSAKIICIEPLPVNIGPQAAKCIEKAVKLSRVYLDKNIYYIPVNKDKVLLKDSDYVGDNTHPTAEGSNKLAIFLKNKVAKIMNWQ